MSAALSLGMLGAFAMATAGHVATHRSHHRHLEGGMVRRDGRFAVGGSFPFSLALLVAMGIAGAVSGNLERVPDPTPRTACADA
ncbi:MAG: hypothetical protein U0360_10590 [Dehalococcoidia bacterium]